MKDRTRRGRLITVCLASLALIATVLVTGCKEKMEQEEGASERLSRLREVGQSRRGSGGRRGRGGGGMRELRMGGTSTTGTQAPGGAAATPNPALLPITPRTISEDERAKKIRAFVEVYGPVTLAYEKDWDGRVVEWLLFTHQGRKVKMPLSMALDVSDPKDLEGYFVIYQSSGNLRKGSLTYEITAASAIPPPPEQPETEVVFEEQPAEPTTAATAGSAPAAGGGGRRGGGRRGGGRRGGMRG